MPRQPKRYKIVGTQPILDHQPGDVFTAVLPKDQERFLVGIGGLEVVKEEPAKDKTPSKP